MYVSYHFINGIWIIITIPPVCSVDQTLVDGECVDDLPVCENDETLVDGQCVANEPIVCDTGFELIDDECILIEDPPMDPGVKTVIIIGVSTVSLGVIFYFIRKFFFLL